MNYETGVLQAFFSQKLNLELTGFIIKGDNLIVTGSMGQLFNAGEINNRGIEFAANAIPVKNLSVNFTYSFIDMNSPIYATPKSHLFLSGNYKLDKFRFSASVQQVNQLNTVYDGSSPHLQDYTLVDAKVSYMVWKFAEIFISGDNLLDQKYETLRYYAMPRFVVFGGFNLHF